MKRTLLLIGLVPLCYQLTAQNINITSLGRYLDGRETAIEIVTYDKTAKKLFTTNAVSDSIDIIDFNDPAAPVRTGGIDISAYGGTVTSVVSLNNGYIAAAIPAHVKTDSGKVAFFDTDGVFVKSVTVGALPDMITVTKDGSKVLVAGEGEPSDDYLTDPEGTVGIIDISDGIEDLEQSDVTIIRFTDAPAVIPGTLHKPGTTWAQDIEPEYIAVNEESTLAAVGCQEANMMIFIDLNTKSVVSYKGLGFKDHSAPGNGLDVSDRDDAMSIRNWNVKGIYMPDAIASYKTSGNTYFVSANEGDGRDYDGYSSETRVKDLDLDPTIFPPESNITADTALGRLKTLTADVIGDTDGDGDVDEIYAYGARSFSIWDDEGNLVWDSGDDFEQYIMEHHPDFFNCDEGNTDEKDSRSDDKGVEPEAIATGKVGDRTYAFIGLERQSGIMVYNITVPALPVFDTFLHTYNEAAGKAEDIAPEGMLFIPAAESHTGKNLLVVSHEVSGSVLVYQIDEVTSSTHNMEQEHHWSVYPNPVKDILHIAFDQQPDGREIMINVYDVVGRNVLNQGIRADGKEVSLDLAQLHTGVYYLNVMDGGDLKKASRVILKK